MKTEERQLRAAGYTEEAAKLRKNWRKLTLDYEIYSIEHKRAFYRYRCVIDRAEVDEAEKIKQFKGLTNPQSDVIITNENIKQSFGEETSTLQQAIDHASPIISIAFKRHQNELKIIDSHSKNNVAYFSPLEGGIVFNIGKDALPSNEEQPQFYSYFHETGHHLDYIIGQKISKGKYASATYRSDTFAQIKEIKDPKGIIVGRYTYKPTFNEMIIEEGNAFIEDYRNIIQQQTGKKSSIREVYEAIFKDFEDKNIALKRQLSDILDGVTNGRMQKMGYNLGSSHSINDSMYWQKHPVGGEAFAHFTSAFATSSNVAEMLINIFPKSFEIYKEIMKL